MGKIQAFVMKWLPKLGKPFAWMGKFWKFIPLTITGLYIAFNTINIIIDKGFGEGGKFVAKQLLTADYQLRVITQGVIQEGSATFADVFGVINSLVILYYFIKFFNRVIIIGILDTYAYVTGWFIALLFLFLVEMVAVTRFINAPGFVPLKDGVWFFIKHLPLYWSSFTFLSWDVFEAPTLNASEVFEPVNASNSSVNAA